MAKGLSTLALITNMENASEDQNLDDETSELTRRLNANGQDWNWRYFGGVGHRIIVKDHDGDDWHRMTIY
jgi:hypothetical protein